MVDSVFCCISFDSYIKPQLNSGKVHFCPVVYLLIPTSNHNLSLCLWVVVRLYIFWFLHQTTTICAWTDRKDKLYIFWFLHQTTTSSCFFVNPASCISFDSYIKPQRWWLWYRYGYCCISFDSYIKPQPFECLDFTICVVYLLIPTSNHNLVYILCVMFELYIFWFLHQTTTMPLHILRRLPLYIFWFLHQTTTSSGIESRRIRLYIFWFLHQTTT